MARDRHDGNMGRGAIRLELARRFPAIDAWQRQVHQDAARLELAGFRNRFGTRSRLDRTEARLVQVLGVQLPSILVVVHDQHERTGTAVHLLVTVTGAAEWNKHDYGYEGVPDTTLRHGRSRNLLDSGAPPPRRIGRYRDLMGLAASGRS